MLLVLCSAYIVLLGHSIIPHHHHDSEADLAAHHTTEHQHDHDQTSLPNLLGHFLHSEAIFTSTVTYQLHPSLVKLFPVVVFDLSKMLTISELQNFPYTIDLPPEFNITCLDYRKSYGLRGPPTI